jgi:hypothetical protein
LRVLHVTPTVEGDSRSDLAPVLALGAGMAPELAVVAVEVAEVVAEASASASGLAVEAMPRTAELAPAGGDSGTG